MPIEVLTREEVEKIIEEKIKKFVVESDLARKIAELESLTRELKDNVAKLSAAPLKPLGVREALVMDLAERADLLEILESKDSLMLRPKRYLGTQAFRAVSEIVRKHGGAWSSDRRMFIIKKI